MLTSPFWALNSVPEMQNKELNNSLKKHRDCLALQEIVNNYLLAL